MSLNWIFMCAYDNAPYDENQPTTIFKIPTMNREVKVFFNETNILRAHSLLVTFIAYCTNNSNRFPIETFVPEVIEQIQTFSLRTVPFHTMQQRQIGLDLFRFWPNTNDNPKFTIINFKTWLTNLIDLFDMFFHDMNTEHKSSFICNKFNIFIDKLCDIQNKNIHLSELYIFNMATAVINEISKMAAWAQTSINFQTASLDPIKKSFQDLESNFDHIITQGFESAIPSFIAYPNELMQFYNRNY